MSWISKSDAQRLIIDALQRDMEGWKTAFDVYRTVRNAVFSIYEMRSRETGLKSDMISPQFRQDLMVLQSVGLFPKEMVHNVELSHFAAFHAFKDKDKFGELMGAIDATAKPSKPFKEKSLRPIILGYLVCLMGEDGFELGKMQSLFEMVFKCSKSEIQRRYAAVKKLRAEMVWSPEVSAILRLILFMWLAMKEVKWENLTFPDISAPRRRHMNLAVKQYLEFRNRAAQAMREEMAKNGVEDVLQVLGGIGSAPSDNEPALLAVALCVPLVPAERMDALRKSA